MLGTLQSTYKLIDMELVRIITDPKPILYAIWYDENDTDELTRIFEQWEDPAFLLNFFEQHFADLNQFGNQRLDVEEASDRTIEDFYELQDKLFDLAEADTENPEEQLQMLFRPLNDLETELYPLQKSKARPHRKSWLRLYALRIAPHLYVITGGAIKLTWRMEEREHTQQEYQKMNRAVEFLKEEGLMNEKDFERLELGL